MTMRTTALLLGNVFACIVAITPAQRAMAQRVVLEEPGILMVHEGLECAESTTALDSQGDIRLAGSLRLPAYATQATVFLNGWRLLFIDDDLGCTTSDSETDCFAWQQSPPAIDHHLASMKVWMDARQNGDMLTWAVYGHLQDKTTDDPFALCYTYITLAWNDTRMDVHVNNDIDQNWTINPPGATARMSSLTGNPAGTPEANAAVLPRGVWIRWVEDTDHHLLQTAYKYTQGRGNGIVTWDSEAILKDDAQWRSYSLNELVATLGGRHVDVLQLPFTIAPRQPSGGNGCISGNYPIYSVTEYEVPGLPFEYALPMLTGWDLWYPCGDEHVGEIGMWVHDVTYDKAPDGSGGTLRYTVTSILRDKDSRPGHGALPMVSILGLQVARPFAEASPSRLVFPYCTRSDIVGPQRVTLTNGGIDPLTIGVVETSGLDRTNFRIGLNACSHNTLSPGGLCAVEINFQADTRPRLSDTYHAELVIPSNTVPGGVERVPLEANRPCAHPTQLIRLR